MRIIQSIKEKIEGMLKATQAKEQTNRRKAAHAYSPNAHDRFRQAAEQNARDSAEYNEQLKKL